MNGSVLASAELYDPGIVVATHVDGRGTFDNQGNEVTFKFRATQADDGSRSRAFCILRSRCRYLHNEQTKFGISPSWQHGRLQRLGSFG